MTAKEMFEELGYTLTNGKLSIEYEKTTVIYNAYQRDINFIRFELEEKRTVINGAFITLELKAINKQIEELGWNNE